MGNKHLYTTLGELLSSNDGFVQTGPFGSQLHASDYVEKGIPCIMPANISGNRICLDDIAQISKKDALRLSKHIVKIGDIVYSRRGDVTRKALIRKTDAGMFCGTGCLLIRPGDSVDPQFLFYHLSTPQNQEWIIRHAIGATMPNLNTGILSAIPLQIPELNTQKAIAHILGSLDDRIELNRRMNETLESMAQALFKSWFVDFDPVIDNALANGKEIPDALRAKAELRMMNADVKKHSSSILHNSSFHHLFPDEFICSDEMGWIPKGWGVGALGDYLVVKRGGSPRPIHDYLVPQGLPWVKIADATAAPSRFLTKTKDFIKPEGLKKTIFLKRGSLILSNSATPGLPVFLDLDACIHDGWLYFPEKKHFDDLYLYQLFLTIREELLSMGSGTIFTNLKTDILKNKFVIVPSNDSLKIFEQILATIFEKLHGITVGNIQLSNLRDTLLPKLISGEIRIPDAEKMVEDLAL